MCVAKVFTGPAEKFFATSIFRIAKLIKSVNLFFGIESTTPLALSLAMSFVNCANNFDGMQSEK